MCNLYSVTRGQAAIRELARVLHDATGNLPSLPGVYPDYPAPIVRNGPDGVRELVLARWGMPTPQNILVEAVRARAAKLDVKGKSYDFDAMIKTERDPGVTNIRNTASGHWKRWLDAQNRCIVPFTSFSEFNRTHGGEIWFAFDDTRPLAFFAGLTVRGWTSVRKVKEGETTNDLFGFLTTMPNAEVAAVHPNAMPVILTKPEEIKTWLTAPALEAPKLQRPLPDGTLRIVARGAKEDVLGAA